MSHIMRPWLLSSHSVPSADLRGLVGFFLVLSVNLIPVPLSLTESDLPVHASATSSCSLSSPLSPPISPPLFHSRLKTYLFFKSFPP